MKKSFSIILLVFVLMPVALGALLFLFTSGEYIHEYRLKRRSEHMIEKIEEYKTKNGFYPKKITDVGFPEPDESGPIFYEPKDSNTSYEIYFGMSLGESITYNSKTKKWFP